MIKFHVSIVIILYIQLMNCISQTGCFVSSSAYLYQHQQSAYLQNEMSFQTRPRLSCSALRWPWSVIWISRIQQHWSIEQIWRTKTCSSSSSSSSPSSSSASSSSSSSWNSGGGCSLLDPVQFSFYPAGLPRVWLQADSTGYQCPCSSVISVVSLAGNMIKYLHEA